MAPRDTPAKSREELNYSQQIKFLKKIDFFENFDAHELKQFLSVSKWLKVPSGRQIIKENTIERVFYILVKGEVSVIKTVQGNETIELTTLSAGACFGEMSLVMDVKRTAGVVTKTEAFILMVRPEIINTSNVFLQLKFYKRFCEIMVSRLILANERVAGTEKFTKVDKPVVLPHPPQENGFSKEQKGTFTSTPIPPPPAPQEQKEPTPSKMPPTPKAAVKILPPMPAKKDRIIKKKLKQQLSSLPNLPVNPAIARQISPLLTGEVENTRFFADLVLLDPVISCKIMQVANSSFFRRTTPVSTVPHAMISVGMKQIQEAVSEIIEQSAHTQIFGGFPEIASSFWRHSVVVARIASMLKDIIRLNLPSDVYLAALLHDIGILALDTFEPNFYPHLTNPDSIIATELNSAETTYIGIDHCQAGNWYGESIGLAETYNDVMLYHHSVEKCRENSLLCAIIHLADNFATTHGCGIGPHCPPSLSILESYGWVIIQDHHRPFLEVNICDFVNNFNQELISTWDSLTDDLNF